jgi:hypothetical protein
MVNKIISFFKSLNERQALLILIGVTFGLRLYAVLMAQGIANDSAAYGFMTRDFIKGDILKGLSSPLHPFYPLLISLVSPDTAHVEIAGRLISLFFGTLTIIPIFYLSKEIVGQKGAIFSGLFYSFHPYLVTYSGMLLSEAAYWGLLVFSVFFFWAGLKRGSGFKLIISGSLLAMAYLTRPEGIGYLSVFLIWFFFYEGYKKRWFKKCYLVGSLILPFLVLTIPYLVHLHRETGQWVISRKAVEVQRMFIEGDGAEDNNPTRKKVEGVESKKVDWRIFGIGKNIIQYIPFTTYHYLRAYHFALWVFLLFGLIRVRQKEHKGEFFIASLVLFHLLSLSTFTNSTIRYSIPLIPLSLFWAGGGVLELWRFISKIKVSKPEIWVSLFLALALIVQLAQGLRPERKHRGEQRIIGIWLKENTPRDSIIMSNSPQEAFYAEREFIMFPSEVPQPGGPSESYQEIIRYAKTKGVRYILINKNTHEMIPGFIESIQSTDLKEIFRKKDQALMIYEVVY